MYCEYDIERNIHDLDSYELYLLQKEYFDNPDDAFAAESLYKSLFLDQERVSDVIGEEYKEWSGSAVQKDFMGPVLEGDYVYINSGTGTGKTFFIFNVLAPYAKEKNDKILYLCNRVTLKTDADRLKKELKADNVDIKTYQSVESIIANSKKTINDEIPFGCGIRGDREHRECFKELYDKLFEYKYIVADEMHYFLEDSNFNTNTHYVHEFLLKSSPQIKILISATGHHASELFQGKFAKGYRYTAKSDKSYMKIHFYKDNRNEGHDIPLQYIKRIIETRENEKILYFVDKKERIDDIWLNNEELREHMYCMFSESQEDPNKIRNTNCIKSIGEDDDITFDRRLLIATSVLSNGVTLRDRNIKHIICDVKDIFTAIQCIGRKRPYDKRDRCNVYIRYYHPKEFTSVFERATKAYDYGLKLASMRETTCHEWGKKIQENFSDIYYIDWLNNGIIKPNMSRIESYYQTMQVCNKMYAFDKEAFESDYEYESSYAYIQTFKYYGDIPNPVEVLKENDVKEYDIPRIIKILEPYDGISYPAKSVEISNLKKAFRSMGIVQDDYDYVIEKAGYKREVVKKTKRKITFWEINKCEEIQNSNEEIAMERAYDYY